MSEHIEPTGEIHEAAALFPMLPDDELNELAEDIKANGLIHPIVLDSEGVLIDGRNRLAACRLAGVAPRFTALNGHDPIAYIISANVRHRHLTKSQQAMAMVMVKFLESKKYDYGKQGGAAEESGVSHSLLTQAFTVMEHAPDLAPEVMAKTKRLDVAYEEAKEKRRLAETLEERARQEAADFACLLAEAPGLAVLVDEGKLSLRGAMGELEAQRKEERETRTRHTKHLWQSLVGTWMSLVADPEAPASYWMPGVRGYQGADLVDHLLTADGVRDLARLLDTLAGAIDARGGQLE